MTPRNLTGEEIQALERRGCMAEDWGRVLVSDPFRPERLARAGFSGEVQLGVLDGTVAGPGGTRRPCGIYDSRIHDCRIGDGVRIAGAHCIAHYEIGDRAVIEDVGTLAVEAETAFGNGCEIDILNEAGGRPLRIFERLSAPMAYLLVLYRHDAGPIQALEGMVDRHAAAKKSGRGRVGPDCRIEQCGTLIDVSFGPAAAVRGALELREGTVASTAADPAIIGPGVVARNFIVQSGSRVEDGVVLTRCFVGQGVRLGRQFSAENSAFFANCEGYHGEACSIFAGPYTTTHHKSTLLIAGLFSFFNAGSGTNQSNHMYKLGPVHQGIMLRGAKTGSASYMLWPSRIGPFSVVIGKNMSNFDLGDFPFSYILGEGDRTEVMPAMNLITVGTLRDSAKWPARDRRADPDKLDPIVFDLFSPYVMGKVVRALAILRDLYEKTPRERESILHKGASFTRLGLRASCKYYDIALRIFYGECLLAVLEERGSKAQARARLAELASSANGGEWVDLAGLLAPAGEVETLTRDLAEGRCASLDELEARFRQIHAAYGEEKLRWFVACLASQEDINAGAMSDGQMDRILTDWRDARVKLNNMILIDARKEFDAGARIGFGIDGGEEVQASDFEAVRGTFEDNKFVQSLRQDSERAAAAARQWLDTPAG